MPKVIVKKSKFLIKHFRGKAIGIVRPRGGGRGAERGVIVMDNASLNIHEVGDVFVTIVEVVGEDSRRRKEDEGSCGDRLGGIPNVGLEKGVICATELLDAEVVVVDKALEGFFAILHRAHFDSAAHAIKGHGDHGVTGLPTDGAVFGIVND